MAHQVRRNAVEQHEGIWAHTEVMHGSPPHVALAIATQAPSQSGGLGVQHEGCWAHTVSTHGS